MNKTSPATNVSCAQVLKDKNSFHVFPNSIKLRQIWEICRSLLIFEFKHGLYDGDGHYEIRSTTARIMKSYRFGLGEKATPVRLSIQHRMFYLERISDASAAPARKGCWIVDTDPYHLFYILELPSSTALLFEAHFRSLAFSQLIRASGNDNLQAAPADLRICGRPIFLQKLSGSQSLHRSLAPEYNNLSVCEVSCWTDTSLCQTRSVTLPCAPLGQTALDCDMVLLKCPWVKNPWNSCVLLWSSMDLDLNQSVDFGVRAFPYHQTSASPPLPESSDFQKPLAAKSVCCTRAQSDIFLHSVSNQLKYSLLLKVHVNPKLCCQCARQSCATQYTCLSQAR